MAFRFTRSFAGEEVGEGASAQDGSQAGSPSAGGGAASTPPGSQAAPGALSAAGGAAAAAAAAGVQAQEKVQSIKSFKDIRLDIGEGQLHARCRLSMLRHHATSAHVPSADAPAQPAPTCNLTPCLLLLCSPLSTGAMDLMTDEAFLEAVLSFMTSIPTADIYQEKAWQQVRGRPAGGCKLGWEGRAGQGKEQWRMHTGLDAAGLPLRGAALPRMLCTDFSLTPTSPHLSSGAAAAASAGRALWASRGGEPGHQCNCAGGRGWQGR